MRKLFITARDHGKLWIVMERMKSILEEINTEIQESTDNTVQLQEKIAEIDAGKNITARKSNVIGQMPPATNYELDHNVHCRHPQKAQGDRCQCMWCLNCGMPLNVCKLHTKPIEFKPIQLHEKKAPLMKHTYDTQNKKIHDALIEFEKKVEVKRKELLDKYDPREYDFYESEIVYDLANPDDRTFTMSKRIGAVKKHFCDGCGLLMSYHEELDGSCNNAKTRYKIDMEEHTNSA